MTIKTQKNNEICFKLHRKPSNIGSFLKQFVILMEFWGKKIVFSYFAAIFNQIFMTQSISLVRVLLVTKITAKKWLKSSMWNIMQIEELSNFVNVFTRTKKKLNTQQPKKPHDRWQRSHKNRQSIKMNYNSSVYVSTLAKHSHEQPMRLVEPV